jgi:Uma2 family endonuclease
MSTVATTRSPAAVPPLLPVRRFSVDEYHRMGTAGVLTEDDPVELLDGWVVPKMRQSPEHAAAIAHAHEVLRRLLPEGLHVRVQCPVTTPDSEPEPDLLVVSGAVGRYLHHHPGPGEVLLVVEVADSSIERERGIKADLYARAGFPFYWIVNLVNSTLEIHSAPSPDGYRRREVLAEDESAPVVLEGREVSTIRVADLRPL